MCMAVVVALAVFAALAAGGCVLLWVAAGFMLAIVVASPAAFCQKYLAGTIICSCISRFYLPGVLMSFSSSNARCFFLRHAAPAAAALLLAGCNTVAPPATTTAAVASRAPVHESSVYSDGSPVAQPAPAPASAPAPVYATVPATPAAAGLHLQAGTFSSQTSANGVADGIRKQLPALAHSVKGAAWREFPRADGPFASDAERSQAAAQIRSATGNEVVNAAP